MKNKANLAAVLLATVFLSVACSGGNVSENVSDDDTVGVSTGSPLDKIHEKILGAWKILADETGAEEGTLTFNEDGTLDAADLPEDSVFGFLNDIGRIANLAKNIRRTYEVQEDGLVTFNVEADVPDEECLAERLPENFEKIPLFGGIHKIISEAIAKTCPEVPFSNGQAFELTEVGPARLVLDDIILSQ